MISLKMWTMASFTGWLLGIFLLVALSVALDAVGIGDMQFYVGLGMGAGVGFVQWRVLMRVINMSKIWWLSSIIGLGLPFLIFDLFRLLGGRSIGTWYIPVSVLLGSALCGLVQQGVLLRMGFKARTWMFTCVLGWTLAALTVLSMDFLKNISSNNWVMFCMNVFLILFGGIVLGFVTGLRMKSILRA